MVEPLRLEAEIVDKWSAQLRAMSEGLEKVKTPKGIIEMGHHFERINEGAKKMRETLGEGLKSAMEGLGVASISAGAAIAGVIEAGKRFGETTAELSRFSQETQTSVNTIKLWEQAAGRFGVSAEAVRPALKKLSEGVRDIKRGLPSELNQLYSVGDVGSRLAAQLKASKSTDEANEATHKAIAELVAKNNLVGARRLAQLMYGDESLARFDLHGNRARESELEETRKRLYQVTPQDEANAKVYEKAYQDLSDSFTKLRDKVGADVTPALNTLFEDVSKFLDQNGTELSKDFHDGLTTSIKDINDFAATVKDFYEMVKPWLPKVSGEAADSASHAQPGQAYTILGHGAFGLSVDKGSLGQFLLDHKEWERENPGKVPTNPPDNPLAPWGDPNWGKSETSGLLHKSAFVIGGGSPFSSGSSDSEGMRLIRQGVFDALVQFDSWKSAMRDQGFGGAALGGVVRASYQPGGSVGGAPRSYGAGTSYSGPAANTRGANPDVVAYIRQKAQELGVDPEVALRVAGHEGLRAFDPNKPDGGGDGGSSFGPFQLHYGGVNPSMPNAGLGDDFTAATGLNARNSSTWRAQVDFALQHARQHGWGAWMGARAEGITGMTGIGGSNDVNGIAAEFKKRMPHLSSEECVALAKAAVGDPRSVRDWRRGDHVMGGHLAPGTPIATFMDRAGRASNLYDGGQGVGAPGNNTTHAGVFLGYTSDGGMQVLEQYRGSGGPHVKTYYPGDRRGGEKDANNYFSINGPDGKPLGGANNPLSILAENARKAAEAAQQQKDAADKLKQSLPEKPNSTWGASLVDTAFNPGQAARDARGRLDIHLHQFPRGTRIKTDTKPLFRDVGITKSKPLLPTSTDV